MARFTRMEVLNTVVETGLVPVFYHKDPEVAKNVLRACVDAGVRIFEFTNRGDFAYEVFGQLEKFAAKEYPQAILGVGSIVDPYAAGMFISNGANFIVGPCMNTEVAKICNRKKIPYSPGCGSVTEISAAEELGVEIVKIFPGMQVGGPEFVKAVLGPMPWTKIMPTGGVESTRESISAWFKAGVACVGMGSNLIPKDAITKNDWKAITAKVAEALSLIKEAKSKK